MERKRKNSYSYKTGGSEWFRRYQGQVGLFLALEGNQRKPSQSEPSQYIAIGKMSPSILIDGHAWAEKALATNLPILYTGRPC